MRRKTKNGAGVVVATPPTPQCGRSTKSTLWKILFLTLGLTVALLYRTQDPDTELAVKLESLSEDLSTEYLKVQIQAWLERRKGSDGGGERRPRGEAGGDRQSVRMFQNCLADNVTLTGPGGGERERRYSQITEGHNLIYFSERSWCRNTLDILSVEGDWRQAGLEGLANITYTDGRFALATFHQGALEGELRTFRCLLGPCNVWEEEEEDGRHDVTVADQLENIISYRGGRPDRQERSWWFPVGGGLLSCPADEDGLAEGSDCLYLYPDFSTALLGTWSSGRMERATQARLANIRLAGDSLELVVRPTPGKEDVSYREDISTSTLISSEPRLADPFEEKTVYVAQSGIENGGEGLFLRRNVQEGDLVAYYNGVRMTEQEARLRKEDRRSPYRIHGWDGEILNIPVGQQFTENYSASSAHKANHAKKANSEFRNLQHPRFGKILGIFMLRDAVAGEEILVDYGYIEKAMATEAGINMLLEAAQAMSGLSDRKEFKQEMKRAIGYIREKVVHLKPLINTMKMAKTFMS